MRSIVGPTAGPTPANFSRPGARSGASPGHHVAAGRVLVSGYLSDFRLPCRFGDVDPSRVAVARNMDADEGTEAVPVDVVMAVADDGVVDLSGDDQGQWIRSQTSAAQIAEILQRRDQAAATGEPPACLAGTTIPGSAFTAALLAEDERTDAGMRPGPRPGWRFRAPSARNLLIALAGASGKVVGRVPAVTAAVIVVIATLAFIAARHQPGTSPDPMKWPTLAPRPVPSSGSTNLSCPSRYSRSPALLAPSWSQAVSPIR